MMTNVFRVLFLLIDHVIINVVFVSSAALAAHSETTIARSRRIQLGVILLLRIGAIELHLLIKHKRLLLLMLRLKVVTHQLLMLLMMRRRQMTKVVRLVSAVAA